MRTSNLRNPTQSYKMMLSVLLLPVLLSGALADVSEKARLRAARVNSDFPGLEAPLHSPAGSISLRHDPSPGLCKDPFHSFLCSPLGARRTRPDGRLRQGAPLPAEQQPLESGSALLPESIPRPSAPSRFYLPDLPPTTQPPLQTFETKNLPEKVKPPSNAYLPIGDQPLSTNQNPVVLPKEPSRQYLPLDEPNVTGESTNLEGSALLPASISKDASKHDEESHTLERLCNDPFHSFLCKPLKPRKRIDGKIRPNAKIPPNVLIGASSIRRESRVLPSESGSALLPASIGRPSNNYLPSAEDKPNFGGYSPPTTTPNPFNPFSTNKPFVEYSPSPTNNLPVGIPSSQGTYTYSRPSNSFTYPSPGSPFPTQSPPQTAINTHFSNFPASAQQNGYTYQKPTTNFNVQTTNFSPKYQNPTTTVRPVFNNISPSPSNIQQNILQPTNQNGYQYNKPSTQFTYSTPRPAFTTFPTSTYYTSTFQTTHFPETNNIYSNPTNIQQSFARPSNDGYNYQKPAVGFPTPSTTTTPRPNQFISNQYPLPSNVQENSIRPNQNGYNYPKPSNPFTYQTTVRPSTTQAPILYPNPSNVQENIFKPSVNSGYNYPKPSVPFTPRPTTPSTTLSPFQQTYFPNPTNIQQNCLRPSGNNGYNYQKPSEIFTTKPNPSTYQPQTFSTTTYAPTTFPTSTQTIQYYPTAKPTNIFQSAAKPNQNGYEYQKPSTIYTYRPSTFQTTQRPNTIQTINPIQQYQKPTNIQQNTVRPGYSYEKPLVPFVTGTTKPPTTFFTQPPTYQSTFKPISYQTTKRPIVYQSTSLPSSQEYHQPNPTNIQQSIAKPNDQSGYFYQKPSIPFNYGTTYKPTTTTIRPTFQTTTFRPVTYQPTSLPSGQNYQYQRPSNDNVAKPNDQNGYYYQKPSIPFNYNTTPRPTPIPTSTYRPTFQTTTSRPVIYQSTSKPSFPEYPQQRPTNIQQNFANPNGQNGYNYNKPGIPYTDGTTPRPTSTYRPTQFQTSTYQTTTTRPQTFQTSTYAPSTFQSTTYRPTIFETTTYKPTIFQTTKRPGYNYPKPTSIQNTYTYPKPTTIISTRPPFTTTRVPFYSTTLQPTSFQSTTQIYQNPNPSNVQQNVVQPDSTGYHYNKPSTPFTYPTTSRPINPYPNPSNVQENIAPQPSPSGYQYNRPAVPFELPSNNQYRTAENSVNPRVLQFGDRINPKIATKTITNNHISRNDEFQPLRNFEII